MNFNDKCLLVLKPTEPFQHWVQHLVKVSEDAMKKATILRMEGPPDVSLETLQADASCYILPNLPPQETATFIENHFKKMFDTELTTWCQFKEAWPSLDFSHFIEYFKFNFYFDWMDFLQGRLDENRDSTPSLTLLVKPHEGIKDYLRSLLSERYHLSPQEIEAKLDSELIQNGSTAVLSNIEKLEEVEGFLESKHEDIFKHQLRLWGGEDSEAFWPRDLDLQTFRQWFKVEIHRHTYLMLH